MKDLDLSKTYTYADYLRWTFEEAVELIKGKIFKMSPAPNTYHQDISTKLLLKIGYYFGDKSCKVFHAPFDVRLPLPPDQVKEDKISPVLFPDLVIELRDIFPEMDLAEEPWDEHYVRM